MQIKTIKQKNNDDFFTDCNEQIPSIFENVKKVQLVNYDPKNHTSINLFIITLCNCSVESLVRITISLICVKKTRDNVTVKLLSQSRKRKLIFWNKFLK